MRIFFLILLQIQFGIYLNAQQKIVSGTVIDGEQGGPLVGAQIISGKAGTITDYSGRFKLELPSSADEITISYLGYFSQTMAIDGTADVGTVSLTVNPTSLNEIIVQGSLYNYRSDFAGSNFKLSQEFIKNTNPTNTEEILRTIPGVNIVGDMGLSNRPNISIRGSWGRRSKKILLMEDGSPIAPAPYLAPGAYYNPVSDRLQAIEVYKGADMLRFGPNNMYGAVNYITALPPQKPELRVKIVGGQRNYSTQLLSYGGTWKNLGALVEVVHKKFDGFTDNSSVKALNLNAKIFASLSENQSLYFKISGQYENNQASLSSITPFTYQIDPIQNPFDADRFTMRRYGLDIIHKWLPKKNIDLISKIYASDFERDWWRQVNTVIKASEVENYVGDEIFNTRYRYLQEQSFDDEDYVRVGKISYGRESTTDSQWLFTVSGISETFHMDWKGWETNQKLEIGMKLHQETYKDRLLAADSSRWARSGRPSTDLSYYLWSVSGYVRNEFSFHNLLITPIVRFEHIDMTRQNLLELAKDPSLTSLTEGEQLNKYDVVLPGITLAYKTRHGEVYGSIYEGFIAPSKVFGFFVERDGVLTNPFQGEQVNIQPELSTNIEVGFRGSPTPWLDGQLTFFNNTIRNFIAGGENEIFQEPGKMNIQGFEAGVNLLIPSLPVGHKLIFHVNSTFLRSRVLDGALVDKDAFGNVIHSSATRQEFINHVNNNPDAYELYMLDAEGNEVVFEGDITEDTFESISKAVVRFGKGYVEGATAPYTPPLNLSTGMSYSYKGLSAGITYNYVGRQYAEFMNFENDSADGALGKLPSYYSIDTYLNYDFKLKNSELNVFVNGKNVSNNIYKASRLNRAGSGIFTGGYRQIIVGVSLRI